MKNINFRIRITKAFVITVAIVLLLFLFIKENKNQLDKMSADIATTLNQAIQSEDPTQYEPRFETVYKHTTDNAIIIVDKETGVQYLYRKFMNSGGLTVLLDETGKPLLYEEKE